MTKKNKTDKEIIENLPDYIDYCLCCGGDLGPKKIAWAQAFDKFGFGDGDGQVFTYEIAEAIESKFGLKVETAAYGLHNTVISSIKNKEGKELIPKNTEVGYDNPVNYLPTRIVKFLDRIFASDYGGF